MCVTLLRDKMVRPIDSDMVFISPKEASPQRAENSFEGFVDAAHSFKFIPVNDIPGLWTRDVACKTVCLDEINRWMKLSLILYCEEFYFSFNSVRRSNWTSLINSIHL